MLTSISGRKENETTQNDVSKRSSKKPIREASLVRSIALNGFVANEVYPADLDGDGQLEILCLQSPGCYQSEVFSGTRFETPAEQREIY